MQRWIVRIVICLILGVISTFAVAWGSAAMARRPEFWNTEIVVETDHGVTLVRYYESRTLVQIEQFAAPHAESLIAGGWLPLVYARDSMLPSWMTVDVLSAPAGTQRLEEVRGWPMLALRCRFEPAPSDLYETRLALGGIPVGGRRGRVDPVQTGLPFHPVMPGFLVNTLLFAFAYFILFILWRSDRAGRRRLRRRCPRCAYDLREEFADGCPECGWNRR